MKIHIVKQGDTLYALSQKYGVSLSEIIELNPHIKNPDVINIGDKIKIPAQKPFLAKPMTDNMEPEPIKKEKEKILPKEEVKKEEVIKAEVKKEEVKKEEVKKDEVKKEDVIKVEVKKEEKQPFAQFHVPAQPVQSFYDLPKVPDVEDDYNVKPSASEDNIYPGLSGVTMENITAPYGEIPKLDNENAPWNVAPTHQAYNMAPNMYAPSSNVSNMYMSNAYVPNPLSQANLFPYGQVNFPVYPHVQASANWPNMPMMPSMTMHADANNPVMPPPMPTDIANVGVGSFMPQHYMMPPTPNIAYPYQAGPMGKWAGPASDWASDDNQQSSVYSAPLSEPQEREEKAEVKVKKATPKKKKVKKARRKKLTVDESWHHEPSFPWLNI